MPVCKYIYSESIISTFNDVFETGNDFFSIYIKVVVCCCVTRSCTWMYGELTEKEAVERVDRALDHHLADQFEILLYKKNRMLN